MSLETKTFLPDMSVPQLPCVDGAESYKRFDGDVWYDIDSETYSATLTHAGRAFFAQNDILGLLGTYIHDAKLGNEGPTDTRRFIAEGGNARVFGVGDTRLAIKERFPDKADLPEGLDRMDHLANIAERFCPPWIYIPRHYAVVVPKAEPQKQLLLMEKIDSGVSVGDVLGVPRDHGEDPQLHAHLGHAVLDSFGTVTPKMRSEIKDLRRWAIELLKKGLITGGYMQTDHYLTDIDNNYHNILIEPADRSKIDANYRLSIIDQ